MLGCKGSASVFSPESSTCSACPHCEGCHKTALSTTLRKRAKADAVFLSTKFVTVCNDLDDEFTILRSDLSDRIKQHASTLIRKGFRFQRARTLLAEGRNPFLDFRTHAAYVVVFDQLLTQRTVRKCDLTQAVVDSTRCGKATAYGLVSDALGIGQLIGAITVTRLTATLIIEKTA